MTLKMTPCSWCRHLDNDRADGPFCAAFPGGEGIPREILLGWVDHRDPYPGDQGIRYDPLPGAPDLPRVGGGSEPLVAGLPAARSAVAD